MHRKKVIQAILFTLLILTTSATASANERNNRAIDIEIAPVIVQPAQSQATVSTTTSSSKNVALAQNPVQLQQLIEQNLNAVHTTFSIRYKGDTTNITKEAMAIIRNQIEAHTYLSGSISEYGLSAKGFVNDLTLHIEIKYFQSAEQEKFISEKVPQIVANIIQPSMSQVEKVKAINDYIVLNTTYSYDTISSPHSAYSILAEGKGVCNAYALLAYRLLEEAGFEVRYVTGFANEPHAWNLVKVDGEWYHLDTTWNDPVFTAPTNDMKDFVRYAYFLLTDQQIMQDHQIDKKNYPKATSQRFTNWHAVTAPVQVDNTLYFANEDDDISLYKMDLMNENYMIEKVSNTRVQHLQYANDWLFYSNYSNSGYLYKMRLDGTENQLVKAEMVTKIKTSKQQLIAYSNDRIIYSEQLIASAEEQADTAAAATITKQIENFKMLHPSFEQEAKQLLLQYNSMSEQQKQLLTEVTRQKFNDIALKYKKLQSLSYEGSTQWAPKQIIDNPKKQWTLTLNARLSTTEDNTQHIWLENMFGEKVEAIIDINGSKITITPGLAYVEGVPYTIVISNALTSTSGKKLKKATHLTFELK